jgi:hypothetical protein
MVATFVAIIVLVATLLAAIALMRSVDTSNLIAGSMTFRQGAMQEAERAYQAVMAAGQPIVDPANLMNRTDDYAAGYSAVMLPVSTTSAMPDVPTVLTGAPAGSSTCTAPCVAMTPTTATANNVRYVVERMCLPTMEGLAATPNSCIVPGAVIKGGHNVDSQSAISNGVALPAYRLTVRVDGPPKTGAVAYVQTFMR